MNLPDYSEFLTKEQLEIEEKYWSGKNNWLKVYLGSLIKEACPTDDLSVIEFGCATGHIPFNLPDNFDYLGIEKNELCIQKAKERNPKRKFICSDIRDFTPERKYGLSCAFAFLKHFGFHEWEDIIQKIMSSGKISIFSMPIAETQIDDGEKFHHTWTTKEHIDKMIAACNHKIIKYQYDAIYRKEALIVTQEIE